MAVITDLTWQQLSDNLPAGTIELQPAAAGPPAVPAQIKINVSKLVNSSIDAMTAQQVVKSLAVLLTAGFNAQTAANQGQVAGERLAAFPPVGVGGIAGGYVPMTRSVTSRHELSSAVNIIGAVS